MAEDSSLCYPIPQSKLLNMWKYCLYWDFREEKKKEWPFEAEVGVREKQY